MTPIRELLGQWQIFVLNSVRRRTYRNYCDASERFLAKFPGKTTPQAFDRCDVADYRKWRLEEGAREVTVKFELAVVSSFWNWMIEEKGMHLLNIASKKQYKFF